jgi:hypothetical protein
MPLSPNPSETAAQYAAQLDQEYPGKGAGASYLAFAAKHPGLTAVQAGDAWALTIGLAQFGTGLDAGVSSTGSALGEISSGSAKGAEDVSKKLSWTDSIGNLVNFLTSRAGAIRMAEAVIGIALIIVSIDHLTTNTSAVGKAAHTVAKGAFLA